MIDDVIQKHKEAAEKAHTVLDDSKELQAKIREGLERLDSEITKAKTEVQVNEWGVIGMWCSGLVSDTPGFRAQILFLENKITAHQRFLERAPEIRQEFERQLAECSDQIKGAGAVEDQLSKLLLYRDEKNRLRENYSDKVYFHLYQLVIEIEGFEPELFAEDFLPFFAELQAKYNSKSRVLSISKPDTDSDLERFKRQWRYEFLRHNLLSQPWPKNEPGKGEHLLREMRMVANGFGRGGQPLLVDFNDEFIPKLQDQNPGCKIQELR